MWDPRTNQPLSYNTARVGDPSEIYGLNAKAGREIYDRHIDLCRGAKLYIPGANGEVMKGQWEYQVFARGSKEPGDHLWLSRFLLYRLAEEYGITINLHPKPVKGDWNGSGLHVTFSSHWMRKYGSKKTIALIRQNFRERLGEQQAAYGYQDLGDPEPPRAL